MERKRAWITSATIGVTFVAAAGAVAANTGLLRIGAPNRNIGRRTAADLATGTSPPTAMPSTRAATQPPGPVVVVKYEDVYVNAPTQGAAVVEAAPVAPSTPVTLSRKTAIEDASINRSTPTKKVATFVLAKGETKSQNDRNNRALEEEQEEEHDGEYREEHEGEYDDD